jgi:hypothetical protein
MTGVKLQDFLTTHIRFGQAIGDAQIKEICVIRQTEADPAARIITTWQNGRVRKHVIPLPNKNDKRTARSELERLPMAPEEPQEDRKPSPVENMIYTKMCDMERWISSAFAKATQEAKSNPANQNEVFERMKKTLFGAESYFEQRISKIEERQLQHSHTQSVKPTNDDRRIRMAKRLTLIGSALTVVNLVIILWCVL